jgi:hypothetical protein
MTSPDVIPTESFPTVRPDRVGTPDTVHPLDVRSLTAGFVAVAVALLYLVPDLTAVRVNGALVAAVVVVVLGLGGLLAGARRLLAERR